MYDARKKGKIAPPEFPQCLKNLLLKNNLLEKGSGCILAVSGGLDSVAMLHLFLKLAPELELRLAIVHVNHKLRKHDSDQDQIFVKSLATQHNLPFHTTEIDVKTFAREHKLSVEESARILRYKFFEEVLKETTFDVVATAHTKNDQVETVIDHFLRGSGSTGLRGMLPARDCFIRPLLTFTRQEIEAYADFHKLKYREDTTNYDLNLKRNRIRHELIPYLEKHFNKGLAESIFRSTQIFRETELFLKSTAEEACKSLVSLQEKNEIILDIEGFLGYNELIQKYILIHCCNKLLLDSSTLSYNKIKKTIALVANRKPGKFSHLRGGLTVMVDHDGIVVGRLIAQKKTLPCIEIDLMQGNRIKCEGFYLKWSVARHDEKIAFNGGTNREVFDFDETGSKLVLRGLYPGAYFHPLNLRGEKKISDYFSEKKIPLRVRSRIPILESPKGVVWICGHRMDDRFKVTKETRRVLTLEFVADG